MPFTTIAYVVFFAILFAVYYAAPRRFQWQLLLAASVVFYGWMSPSCLIFLFLTIAITYAGAVGMDRSIRKQEAFLKADGRTLDRTAKRAYKDAMVYRRKWMLGGVVAGLMAMLGTFKYGQFVVDNALAVLGWVGAISADRSMSLDLLLPIGLSFYVFQSLGYCVDVYREEVPAERNFIKHALYVSFFPQVMQGPIGTYATLKPQLFTGHAFDYEQVKFGLQRVAWGFFKKLVIANTIAARINPCWSSVGDYPGSACWLTILSLYAIQLYADFSGYMDIASGCAQMLGIRLDENFETPYFAKSIADFWRKWHITLGTWFKKYVFYSILRTAWSNGLRKCLKGSGTYFATALPTSLALLIVWLFIGLWHGAAWSYVVYGLFHGSFIIAAVWLHPFCDRLHAAFPRLVASRGYALCQIARTFLIVVTGYAIFRPADLGVTARIWKELVSGKVGNFDWLVADAGFVVLCWIAVLVVVDTLHARKGSGFLRKWIATWPVFPRWALYVVGLVTIILFGVYNIPSLNQFAYFKF